MKHKVIKIALVVSITIFAPLLNYASLPSHNSYEKNQLVYLSQHERMLLTNLAQADHEKTLSTLQRCATQISHNFATIALSHLATIQETLPVFFELNKDSFDESFQQNVIPMLDQWNHLQPQHITLVQNEADNKSELPEQQELLFTPQALQELSQNEDVLLTKVGPFPIPTPLTNDKAHYGNLTVSGNLRVCDDIFVGGNVCIEGKLKATDTTMLFICEETLLVDKIAAQTSETCNGIVDVLSPTKFHNRVMIKGNNKLLVNEIDPINDQC